ncbi:MULTISPECIES: LLM class flavin-dependent oxidoreductase [Streptomyces]|uniref:LLM class flavin-dependent oxidoreductase n=1 Tax=Streptomyces TaxID=1883 RepID=UPI000F7916E6|nr:MULTISPECIES: LLM class flavin-dependent oxidoreductase [Streptomyces]RST06974.1 LLM class flavin-dependent oxidoreductase [Streptomyces sp. WAC07149]GLX21724.1 FMNH2-utilizing oxygenase [Streptomyces lavendulae subsp. lavendulae]GLX29141.1 FMNH2-utilizing oxygenase [Streptomyces lavendulae subsp. lavendulae]
MPASASASPAASRSAASRPLHLAVALDGAGRHPAAWREPGARPRELLTARYWADLVAEAEAGLLDFVSFDDALALQSSSPDGPDGRTDQVRGRLDAVLTAARVAPLTRHIGLVPAVTATHTEPFHISKAIATLDHVSRGRAGLEVQVSQPAHELRHFGRRAAALPEAEAYGEAADHVEVVRRLWDSWDDDAEIRDVATGRFVDRDKLHHIDFEGRHFSVRGPSITPRPPQGQPLVTAAAAAGAAYGLIARSADAGHVPARDTDAVRAAVAEIRRAREAAGPAAGPLHLFGDLTVFLDEDAPAASARKERLDALAGTPYGDGEAVFTGTPAQLADLLQDWRTAGLTGFRLRPGGISHDLPAITRALVPELQRRGVFRRAYEADTLRGLLGLARPAGRYAAHSAA